LVISAVGIVFNVGVWIWADGQRVNYDDLPVTDSYVLRAEGFGYFSVYLLAVLVVGLISLGLAFAGARSRRDRPWVAVAAGAMAMFLVMVPVVFLVGHAINHWHIGD
jgi:hypothetical protein